MKKLLAIIPAKKDSERFPGKNMAEIDSKPMIEYTFEAAYSAKIFDQIVVISNNDDVIKLAKEWGFEVTRANPMAFDGRVWRACQHVIQHHPDAKRCTHFCLLLPTNPLRAAKDIEFGFSLFQTIPQPDYVISVSEYPFNAHYALRGWEEENQMGLEPLLAGIDIDIGREYFGPTYFMDGAVYWAHIGAFIKNKWSVSPVCPNTLFFKIPPERAIDVDTPFDLKLVRALMEEQEDD